MLLVGVIIFAWEMVRRGFFYFCTKLRKSHFQGAATTVALGVRKVRASGSNFWLVYEKEGFMLIVHHRGRKYLFDPRKAKLPVPVEQLSGLRILILEYTQDGRTDFVYRSWVWISTKSNLDRLCSQESSQTLQSGVFTDFADKTYLASVERRPIGPDNRCSTGRRSFAQKRKRPVS